MGLRSQTDHFRTVSTGSAFWGIFKILLSCIRHLYDS